MKLKDMASSVVDPVWMSLVKKMTETEENTNTYGVEQVKTFFKEKARQYNVSHSIFLPSLLTSVSHLMRDSKVCLPESSICFDFINLFLANS